MEFRSDVGIDGNSTHDAICYVNNDLTRDLCME